MKSQEKKYYSFVLSNSIINIFIDNLSEPKINNFPEIDVFILISCPLNSIYDLKTFYKPLITPFELELALTEK